MKLREVINFVDHVTALCFTVSNAVYAGNLFTICQQWAAVISFFSCLFSVTVSEQCVSS
jgi:hypothetical protein